VYVGTEATKRDGDNPEAWALLAQAKFRWGDIEDAIYEYKRAISLKPNIASYYFDLGSVYESAKRWSDALQQYERASKIDPQVTAYRASIGILFVRNNVFDEGINILERCRREEPDNAIYQWFLAIAYQESAYQGWTEVEPGHPSVEPGFYPTKYEHIEAAREHLSKARALKFDDADLARELGEVETRIASMTQKKFIGNWIPPVLWALMGLFVMKSSPGGGFFFILLPALYIASCFTPQYKINDRVIQGKNVNAGLTGAWLLGILIMPFVTIYNFIRNYATK
jgi:tetratricopeptide (TPR) repeat protein